MIRNAGGRASEALRSLEVMGTIGPLHLIVVIHHTGNFMLRTDEFIVAYENPDCGGLFTSDEEVRHKLSLRSPDHAEEIKHKNFGTFQQ